MAPSKEHDPSESSKDVSKVGKKRKSIGDKSPSDTKGPSLKKPKPDFTEVEFKFLLRDENQTVTALEKFCQCVNESSYDLIANYAKSSPEANEIFLLLENQNNSFKRRKPEELVLIFTSFNLILSRAYLGESGNSVKEQAIFIAKKLLSNHLPIMYYVMHKSAKKSVLIACLKLFTSIIMQGQRISLDAVLSFDFQNDNFKGLFLKKYTMDSSDIRSNLVHLVMSFLMTDDTLVIKHLCETGVLASLFPLLSSDSAKNIQVVLSTLRDKVVMNADVSKTAKLKIFSANSLNHLAALYKWKPPPEKPSKAAEPTTQNRNDVRSWVHSFLLELCCSHKHGINFYDPQYGTTNASLNQHLWHFLCQFGDPPKDVLRTELISKILTACPDLVCKYLSRLQPAVYPRESAVWLNAMHQITHMFENHAMLKVFTAKVLLPTDKLVAIAQSVILPPKDVAHQINLAIKHESVICNFVAFKLLSVILKNMKTTIDYCKRRASLLKDDPSSMSSRLVDFVENFKKQALNVLPNLSNLMLSCKASLQTALLGKVDIEPKEAKDDLPPVNLLHHLTLMIDVMCLYGCFASKVAPDFVTLLSGMQSVCQSTMAQDSDNQAAMAGLKKALLHLVATFNSSILQAKQSESGDSMIHMLFKVSQPEATHNDDTWIDMLAQLLSNSGYFGNSSDEITVWLDCLQDRISGRKGNLSFDDKCAFVSRCVQAVLKEPYSYSERVVQVNQEATEMGIEMEEKGSQQFNALVRDILSQPATELMAFSQLTEAEAMETEQPTTSSCIFTGLMPAAIDIISASKSKTDRWCFLHIVQHLLRIQADPLPLALMVSRVDSGLLKQSPALCSALTTLLPKTLQKEWSSLSPTDEATTFSDLAERIYTMKMTYEEDQKWISMLPLKPRERRMAVKQLLQYISILLSQSKEKPKSRGVLQALFQFLFQILEKMAYEAKFASVKTEVKEEAEAEMTDVSSNLLTLCSLIFQHDGIRKHFADHASIWFELVTKSMGKVVAVLPASIQEQTPHLSHFKETLISAMHEKKNAVLLETFGQFLSSMNGKELATSVLSLLKFNLTDDDKLSDFGETFLSAMQAMVKEKSVLTDHALPMDALTALLDLVIELGNDLLTATAYDLLSVAPLYSVCVGESHCLKLMERSSTSEDSLKISCLLIQHSPVARRWASKSLIAKFEEDETCVQDNVHILEPYLKFSSDAELKSTGEKLYSLCWKRMVKLLRSKMLEGEAFACAFSILLRLGSLTEDKIESKFEKLHEDLMSSFEATFFTVDVIDTYTLLIERVHGTSDKADSLKLHFALHCFLRITEKKITRRLRGSDVLVRWAKVVESCNLKDCKSAVDDIAKQWPLIVKNVLKYYYLNPQSFKLLQTLCDVVYEEESMEDIAAVDMHAMLLSHSEFLNVMMEESSEAKDNLVEFLLFLVQGDPNCCDSSHISPLLGAYTASLTMTDRRILQMLQVYESAGCDLSSFKPYLWGSAAAEKRAARKGLSQSLLHQASLQDVMDHLNEVMMNKSIAHFPINRQLRPENGLTHEGEIGFSQKIYDPAFFLPLCHQLLGPEFVVDCQHFVMCGLLGFTVAALSSHDAETRSAAYLVLNKLYEHLLGARFLGCTQEQYLVLLIRNTGEAENLRIPSAISAVLSASTKVLLFPTKPLYKVVNKWLTSKPSLDLEHVPLFHTIINSSSPDFEEQREWILTTLVHSICDINDIRICKRSYVFKILLAFYSSPLCNQVSQKLILEILSGSVQVKNSHLSLSNSGILEWITNTLALNPTRPKLAALFIRIIGRLWFSYLSCRDDAGGKEPKDETKKSAYDSTFTNHILLMCRTLLQNIESFRSLTNLSELSRCLSSVLSHAAKCSLGMPDASSASTEKEDLLLLFHHFHKLTLNSKAFTQLMRFVPQAALGKVPENSLTLMMDVDQVSQEDNEDSSALALCSNHLLKVVHLWHPVATTAPELLFFMAQWAFDEATSQSNAAQLMPTVQWFCSLKARSEMLNDDGPKHLLNMLLRAYELSTSLDCRKNLHCSLDAFFFKLFKCIDNSNVDHPIVKVLSSKPFAKCLHAMQESSTEHLSVLVAEVFLGALKPNNTKELMSLSV